MFLALVHAEFKLLYIISMPTALPGDNQPTGFKGHRAWRSPEHTRQDSKFFSFQGLPRASGCTTVLSLQNTMTAKDGDMGIRAYAVHMQFHWTAVGGRVKGVIKILQINYTKKKGKFIYEICTRPSLRRHHLYKLCREERNIPTE